MNPGQVLAERDKRDPHPGTGEVHSADEREQEPAQRSHGPTQDPSNGRAQETDQEHRPREQQGCVQRDAGEGQQTIASQANHADERVLRPAGEAGRGGETHLGRREAEPVDHAAQEPVPLRHPEQDVEGPARQQPKVSRGRANVHPAAPAHGHVKEPRSELLACTDRAVVFPQRDDHVMSVPPPGQ
jgi:hypothetical protein